MKRQDVIDNIEGSRLKKQYLEAFLLQSTFIESLIKRLIENDFFQNLTFKAMAEEYKKGIFQETKHISYVKERLLRQSLFESIEYLGKVDAISAELKKQLHAYREARNSVLHDLVGRMSKTEFEEELFGLVDLGQKILNNQAMVDASASVQRNEELMEAIVSRDQDKMDKFFKKYLPTEIKSTE